MQKQLCALKDVLRLMGNLEDSIKEQFGLGLTEALVLCSIDNGCSKAHTLSEEIGLSPSRLSRVLASLEKKGLLDRQRCEEDKRNWDNSPSNKGTQLLERLHNHGVDVPEPLVRCLEYIGQGE